MNIIIAETFPRSLDRLSKEDQNQVKQAAFDFQMRPENPGFQYHRLDGAKDKNFWSARVNRDLRMIIYRDGDNQILCYADHHDPAYEWAARRKLEVNRYTGAVQIVEVVERTQKIVKRVLRREVITEPILGDKDPEYLMALGVPEDWVEAVRSVDEDGLMELVSLLPEEAAERLVDLACGNV